MTTIDYIGFDIHKKAISFCAKAQDGTILGEGTIPARRDTLLAWAKVRPRPWIGAMEATLFTGWIYDTGPRVNFSRSIPKSQLCECGRTRALKGRADLGGFHRLNREGREYWVLACPMAILSRQSSGFWERMQGWRDGDFIPCSCRNCPVVGACRGGCRANKLAKRLDNLDVHAEPLRMVNAAAEIPPRQPGPEIGATSAFRSRLSLIPSIRFRREEFGALLFRSSPWTITLLNRPAADFLQAAAKDGRTISASNFLRHSGARDRGERESVSRLFAKLIRKGILVAPTNGKEISNHGIRPDSRPAIPQA